MANVKTYEGFNQITKLLTLKTKPITAVNLHKLLCLKGYKVSLRAIQQALMKCLESKYVGIDRTESVGGHQANLYVIGSVKYIHKDDEYYRKQEAQKAEYEETKYSLICGAWSQ